MPLSRTIPVALLLAALFVSCSDREPDVQEPASPDDPPAHLVEKYGPPPAGGPTGRTKSVEGIGFIELSPGYFLMGSEENKSERPRHWVEIGYSFWIAKTELRGVSFDPRAAGARRDPEGVFPVAWPADNPVVRVSHQEAKEFCDRLGRQCAAEIRLPSEAEWEYACRAGSFTTFCFGDAESALGEYAWHSGSSGGRPHAVATRKPNAWGLMDMHGNAAEWCEDPYHETYDGAPTDGSPWEAGGGPFAILRGGSFAAPPHSCRSAWRCPVHLGDARDDSGFRPVAIFPEER